MANIRSLEQIISGMLDFYRLRQPDADTKPGTVIRDLFIEAPASQIHLLYEELAGLSNSQSIALSSGTNLDRLAKNFGLVRRKSTSSTGIALLTFSTLNIPVPINKNSIITSNSGISFSVANSLVVSPENINFYKSIASKYKDQLNFIGINDEYAVEVSVIAQTSGTIGNIGKYSLSNTNITNVSNVINISEFSGGTDLESDVSFKNRVLASFNGASVGTTLGYLSAALSTTGVQDARVIEPGNILMTRDGSIIKKDSNNNDIISVEGSGGKIDVVVLGSIQTQNTESFIFINKSNDNDITNSKNDVILGQIPEDLNKTINKRRSDNLKTGIVPAQPVESIISVSATTSGSNFLPKTIDEYGRVSGNYELIKDDGAYQGSLWAFDRFHWISDRVYFEEDKLKTKLFGQDSTTFTGITAIPEIKQNIPIYNENSIITLDRSIIQLLHTPAFNITRVYNVSTGERYIITDQNYDKTQPYNTTGRIKISGNTLPSNSDMLEVDYNWVVEYDRYSDYDGLEFTNNKREVVDSVDWGYSTQIQDEIVKFRLDNSGNFFVGNCSLPINTVISANKFISKSGIVGKIDSGVYINNLYVDIVNLEAPTSTVNSVKSKNSNKEYYNTTQNTGNFSNIAQVVGSDIYYTTRIIFPSDSQVSLNEIVEVETDYEDVYNVNGATGSANDRQITLPQTSVGVNFSTIYLKITYIANISEIFSSALTSLPASRRGNGFVLQNNFTYNNISNVITRENQIVYKNLSNQFYIDTDINALDNVLNRENIFSVSRMSDGIEFWDNSVSGSISVNGLGNYRVILDGSISPTLNDRVMISYQGQQVRKIQPFTFSNNILSSSTRIIDYDSINKKYFIELFKFEQVLSNLKFKVINPLNDEVIRSATDGYLTPNNGGALISSPSLNFLNIFDISNYKMVIDGNVNPINNGTFDIAGVDGYNNIQVSYPINIGNKNISIVRLFDNKELWDNSGLLNLDGNKIYISDLQNVSTGQLVKLNLFNYSSLNQMPTRLEVSLTDQINNSGVLTISGTGFYKAKDIILTATNTGLKVNLLEAVKKHLRLNSNQTIPFNIKVIKLLKLEKVSTVSSSNDEVLQSINTYDVLGTQIKNNDYFSDTMFYNQSLNDYEVIIPSSINNSINGTNVNSPSIGDKLRATFYFVIENDLENLTFTRNGTLYTNKKFALIDKIYISSGFKNSQSGKITISSFTQPGLGKRYKVSYSYIAPKNNERIVINTNHNRLIQDTTFSIENTRPINADVLVKAANKIPLDLVMNIIIDNNYKLSESNILQNLRDKLISQLTTTKLADIVDSVNLITTAENIQGIVRARILFFNKSGTPGKVPYLQAKENEYFVPNNITINTESR